MKVGIAEVALHGAEGDGNGRRAYFIFPKPRNFLDPATQQTFNRPRLYSGIADGVIYSFPCTTKDGAYEIVQGLDTSDFSRERMDATDAELREEREAVADLL